MSTASLLYLIEKQEDEIKELLGDRHFIDGEYATILKSGVKGMHRGVRRTIPHGNAIYKPDAGMAAERSPQEYMDARDLHIGAANTHNIAARSFLDKHQPESANAHMQATAHHITAAKLAYAASQGQGEKDYHKVYNAQREKAAHFSHVAFSSEPQPIQKGCQKCHPAFTSVTDENSTKDHLDTSVGNQINPKKRVKKDFAWLNQNDYNGNKAAQAEKQAARQAAKLAKKPFLG